MLSLRSVKCSLHAPRSRPRRGHHSAFRTLASRSTPRSTCTSGHNQCYASTQQHSRTNPTPHTSTSVVPIALPSYHPNPTHESSAPRRGLDRGATPSSCLVTAVVTVALAVLPSRSRPWLPSRKRRPHRRGLGVSRRAALRSWRSRMSECLPCRSSVPLSASLPVRLACPVEGTVSGRTRPGMRCPEPVRSWRPSWAPDTAAWTLDGDQAGGRSGTAGVGRRRACALPSVRSGPG